jgi:hypothetical protein
MAAGFSRTVRKPETQQQQPEPIRTPQPQPEPQPEPQLQLPTVPQQQPPQQQQWPSSGATGVMRWGTSLADLAAACGAASPDALLDLTDDELEQLIEETAEQNSSFKVNTLHQRNIAKEAQEKRAAAQQDPIMKFLTDIALERFYDGFVCGLGALNLEDLRGVEEADLDELGLRKLEKRRLSRAIAELDGADQKLLRTPVTSPLRGSPPSSASSPAAATAAAAAAMSSFSSSSSSSSSPAGGHVASASSSPAGVASPAKLRLRQSTAARAATTGAMVAASPPPTTTPAARTAEEDSGQREREREQEHEHEHDTREEVEETLPPPLPSSSSSPSRSNRPRSCPGTPSSWRDDYSSP